MKQAMLGAALMAMVAGPVLAQGQAQQPAGAAGQGQTQKPAGAQGQGQGQKPAGQPGQGQQPAGAQGQGQKPAGAGQGQTQKPAGAAGQGQAQKPAGAAGQGQGQTAAGGTSLGSVTLNRRVMANGEPLAAGTYQIRLSSDAPKPGVGQTPDSERYVEFVRGGKVVGREVATVIPASEVAQVAEGNRPASGTAKVELLKGEDYVRVWINRGGTHYILHMPPAKG